MAEAVTVDQLAGGDHACLTFTDSDERLDLVAEFVASGLQTGQRVIWFTDAVSPADLSSELSLRGIAVSPALESGQLATYRSTQSWLAQGEASADRMLTRIGQDLSSALRDGFTGLRVTTDMCWINSPVVAADQLLDFERRMAAAEHLTMICQYDRKIFDPVTLAFAADTHCKTVAALAYYDTPLLRICRQYRPAGVRLAGEIDHTQLGPLQEALAEALRLDETIHVNLSRLHFIDVTAATALAKAALNLPAGREMIVTCPENVACVLDAVGASQASQLHIQRAP